MLDIWLPERSLEEAMQKSNHFGAKWQLLECKVTNIKMQFQFFSTPTRHIFSPSSSRPSLKSSLPKTAYLYSLSVYLCNFSRHLSP